MKQGSEILQPAGGFNLGQTMLTPANNTLANGGILKVQSRASRLQPIIAREPSLTGIRKLSMPSSTKGDISSLPLDQLPAHFSSKQILPG